MEEEEEINGIVIVTWKTSDFVVALLYLCQQQFAILLVKVMASLQW